MCIDVFGGCLGVGSADRMGRWVSRGYFISATSKWTHCPTLQVGIICELEPDEAVVLSAQDAVGIKSFRL